MKKLLVVLLSMVMAVVGLAGCMPSNGPGGSDDSGDNLEQIIDKNKTQIVFSVFNGGYGYEWAVKAARSWNETNDKYQVIVSPNKDEWYTFEANLEAGTCQYDIMLNTPEESSYAKGYLENLTGVVDAPAKGESRTIREKMIEQEMWDSAFSYQGEVFTVPIFMGVSGFVYDHEIFKDKCFLIGRNGQLINSPNDSLSPGRDGKEGTWDDGHPKNLQEYNLMLGAIKSSMSAYLWSGKFSYYLSPLFWSMFYDYAGRNTVENIFFGLDGTYTNPKTQNVIDITPENGYEVYRMAGIYESFKFIDDYLADPTYYHSSSAKYSTSHTDAQKAFVYGNAFNRGLTADGQAAFLYEGNWWENEARANFNSLYNRGFTDYAYGTRDYRMMMPPMLDDNGVYDKVPLNSFGIEAISVKKQSDTNKLDAIKDFVSYLYSNDVLNETAIATGGLIPFDSGITEAHYSRMTKFARTMNEMFRSEDTYFFTASRYAKTMAGENRKSTWYYAANKSTSYPIDFFLRGAGITTTCNARQLYDANYEYYRSNWETILG